MTLTSITRRTRRLWEEGVTDADTHLAGFRTLMAALEQRGVTPRGTRVLDIGCGDRAPLSLLFAMEGAEVAAVDILPIALGWVRRPTMWVALVRQHRGRAALTQVGRDGLHTWRYWSEMRRKAGKLPFDRVRFRQMDAKDLRFPDNSFDIVVSSAVWEHLDDPRRGCREVNRVLKPGGLAIIQVPPFTSLQGGHHPEWHSVDAGASRKIRPWDHLRAGGSALPVYCNGWRESQYRAVFGAELAVESWEDGPEIGAEWLTPELRSELSPYTERELLLSFVWVWARKKTHPAVTINRGEMADGRAREKASCT